MHSGPWRRPRAPLRAGPGTPARVAAMSIHPHRECRGDVDGGPNGGSYGSQPDRDHPSDAERVVAGNPDLAAPSIGSPGPLRQAGRAIDAGQGSTRQSSMVPSPVTSSPCRSAAIAVRPAMVFGSARASSRYRRGIRPGAIGLLCTGQIARHFGLPVRSGGGLTSPCRYPGARRSFGLDPCGTGTPSAHGPRRSAATASTRPGEQRRSRPPGVAHRDRVTQRGPCGGTRSRRQAIGVRWRPVRACRQFPGRAALPSARARTKSTLAGFTVRTSSRCRCRPDLRAGAPAARLGDRGSIRLGCAPTGPWNSARRLDPRNSYRYGPGGTSSR